MKKRLLLRVGVMERGWQDRFPARGAVYRAGQRVDGSWLDGRCAALTAVEDGGDRRAPLYAQ